MRETIKEILVVGATGTAGSEVVRALLARGLTGVSVEGHRP